MKSAGNSAHLRPSSDLGPTNVEQLSRSVVKVRITQTGGFRWLPIRGKPKQALLTAFLESTKARGMDPLGDFYYGLLAYTPGM